MNSEPHKLLRIFFIVFIWEDWRHEPCALLAKATLLLAQRRVGMLHWPWYTLHWNRSIVQRGGFLEADCSCSWSRLADHFSRQAELRPAQYTISMQRHHHITLLLASR